MSPELLHPEIEDRRRTKYSDRYALGMVIYEVLSGRMPFYRYANLIIPGKVVGGERPKRPQGAEGVWFTDDVWGLLGRCWESQPENRPNIEDVLQCLEKVSRSWIPSSRWLANPPIASSLTQEFSDTESTDGSEVSYPSQVVLDLEESAGIVSGVG